MVTSYLDTLKQAAKLPGEPPGMRILTPHDAANTDIAVVYRDVWERLVAVAEAVDDVLAANWICSNQYPNEGTPSCIEANDAEPCFVCRLMPARVALRVAVETHEKGQT